MTREERDGDPVIALLRRAGAELYTVPLARTVPPRDPEPLRAAARDLAIYDWVVFTSARAVEALATAMLRSPANGKFPAVPAGLGAVGPTTARAVQACFGREPDLIPEQLDAAGLAGAILARVREGQSGANPAAGGSDPSLPPAPLRILFPSADNARRELPEILRRAGAMVDQVTAYETEVSPPPFARLRPPQGGPWDAVLFTTGTVVQLFFEICCREMGERDARAWLAASAPIVLGESAEAALRSAGIAPAARAARATPEDLASTVIQLLGR